MKNQLIGVPLTIFSTAIVIGVMVLVADFIVEIFNYTGWWIFVGSLPLGILQYYIFRSWGVDLGEYTKQ